MFLWRQEDTSSLRLFSVNSSGRQMIRNCSLRQKLHLLLELLYRNYETGLFICLLPPTKYIYIYICIYIYIYIYVTFVEFVLIFLRLYVLGYIGIGIKFLEPVFCFFFNLK